MNLKMNLTTVKCSQANQTIATHHMRHIFTPMDQTIKKYYISCNNLLYVTIQSHPIEDGCYKPNEKCLIVATINPIPCSRPAHHGTFLNVLIDKYCSCKCTEIIIFAHNYFNSKTQTKQHFVLYYNQVYFSLDQD